MNQEPQINIDEIINELIEIRTMGNMMAKKSDAIIKTFIEFADVQKEKQKKKQSQEAVKKVAENLKDKNEKKSN